MGNEEMQDKVWVYFVEKQNMVTLWDMEILKIGDAVRYGNIEKKNCYAVNFKNWLCNFEFLCNFVENMGKLPMQDTVSIN